MLHRKDLREKLSLLGQEPTFKTGCVKYLLVVSGSDWLVLCEHEPYGICKHRRLGSDCADTQSDQSLSFLMNNS